MFMSITSQFFLKEKKNLIFKKIESLERQDKEVPYRTGLSEETALENCT